MPYTFTSALFIGLEKLRSLLGDTTAFRTWCGAANQAAALAKIHLIAKEDDSFSRPCVIIWPNPGITLERIAQGDTSDQFEVTGASTYTLLFEQARNATYAADAEAAAKYFLDNVGLVLAGMTAMSGSAGYQTINRFRLMDYGESSPGEGEGTVYYQQMVEIDIGDGGGQ